MRLNQDTSREFKFLNMIYIISQRGSTFSPLLSRKLVQIRQVPCSLRQIYPKLSHIRHYELLI